MRLYSTPRPIRRDWRVWFAWHPVNCEMADGRKAMVWLEEVERSETVGYGGFCWRHRERLTYEAEAK